MSCRRLVLCLVVIIFFLVFALFLVFSNLVGLRSLLVYGLCPVFSCLALSWSNYCATQHYAFLHPTVVSQTRITPEHESSSVGSSSVSFWGSFVRKASTVVPPSDSGLVVREAASLCESANSQVSYDAFPDPGTVLVVPGHGTSSARALPHYRFALPKKRCLRTLLWKQCYYYIIHKSTSCVHIDPS